MNAVELIKEIDDLLLTDELDTRRPQITIRWCFCHKSSTKTSANMKCTLEVYIRGEPYTHAHTVPYANYSSVDGLVYEYHLSRLKSYLKSLDPLPTAAEAAKHEKPFDVVDKDGKRLDGGRELTDEEKKKSTLIIDQN